MPSLRRATSDPASASTSNPTVPNWLALGCLAIASLCSVLFHGFEFPYNNNVFHIPIVLDAFNSLEGPHDELHRSFGNFVSGFWQLARVLSTEDNIREVFFTLHLLTRFATLILLWLLVGQFAVNRAIALAAVASLPFLTGLLGSISPLGHHELFVNYLTHSEVATVFVLLAWLLQSPRRWYWAAATLGVGFNVNAFVAVWAAIAAWIAMLASHPGQSMSARLRTSTVMAIAFTATAAPTAIWILRSQLLGPPTGGSYDFREFLLAYFPFHTFIHIQAERVGCFAVLAGTCGLLVAHLRTQCEPQVYRMWIGTYVGLLAVVALGMVLPYLTGSRLLLNLYPLRMDAFVVFLTAILLCAQLARRAAADMHTNLLLMIGLFSFANGNLWLLFVTVAAALRGAIDSRLWSILAGGTLAAAILHGFVAGEAPLLREGLKFGHAIAAAIVGGGVAGFALRARHWQDPLLPAVVVAIVTGVVGNVGSLPLLAAYLSTVAALLTPVAASRVRSTIILWILNGGALLSLIATTVATTGSVRSWLPVVCVVAAVLGGRVIPSLTPFIPWSRGGAALPIAAFAFAVSVGALVLSILQGTVSRTGNDEQSRALLAIAQWARKNTPPDTVFLTPRVSEGFYVFARRPIWVEWKSGAAAMWQANYYDEWKSRSTDVARLTTAAGRLAYAREQKIPYVVLAIENESAENLAKLSFRIRNEYFGIVAIDQ